MGCREQIVRCEEKVGVSVGILKKICGVESKNWGVESKFKIFKFFGGTE